MPNRPCWAKLLVLLLIVPLETSAQSARAPLSITVMQGDGAVVDETHTPSIVVRVTAVGASVRFQLPADSGVSFPGNKSQMTVKTDAQGFASSGILTATARGGKYDVQIEALFDGQSATAVVHQTNESRIQATAKTHKSHTMLWVIVGAAGAAGAALAATRGGSNSGSNTPSVTVTAGSPTVGAPN